MTPKLPTLDPWSDKTILTALAVAQSLSLAYASVMVDGVQDWRVIISAVRGVLMGGAVSFGMAVSAQRLGGNMTKTRRNIMTGVVVALFLVSPAIVFAGFYGQPAHVLAYHTLAVIGCDLAAAAVAVGAKVLADKPAEQPQTSGGKRSKPAEVAKKYRCSCGMSTDDQHEWAGHKRHNKDHERIMK